VEIVESFVDGPPHHFQLPAGADIVGCFEVPALLQRPPVGNLVSRGTAGVELIMVGKALAAQKTDISNGWKRHTLHAPGHLCEDADRVFDSLADICVEEIEEGPAWDSKPQSRD